MVWNTAMKGDQFCQQIWNNIDPDVKIILQKKFKRMHRDDFVIEKSIDEEGSKKSD